MTQLVEMLAVLINFTLFSILVIVLVYLLRYIAKIVYKEDIFQ